MLIIENCAAGDGGGNYNAFVLTMDSDDDDDDDNDNDASGIIVALADDIENELKVLS